jgi:hypothetical protein
MRLFKQFAFWVLAFLMILSATAQNAVAQQPDWVTDINWASHDSGPANCPAFYVTYNLQYCLLGGNRACVMNQARAFARSGDPRLQGLAFSYTLLTQCHNGGQVQALLNAGQGNVIAYLQNN